MPYYEMDPVTERPVAVDPPEPEWLKRLPYYQRLQEMAKRQPEAAQGFACRAPGCNKSFSSERARDTHEGMKHKQWRTEQDYEAGRTATANEAPEGEAATE